VKERQNGGAHELISKVKNNVLKHEFSVMRLISTEKLRWYLFLNDKYLYKTDINLSIPIP
jgi:hypothetical protein